VPILKGLLCFCLIIVATRRIEQILKFWEALFTNWLFLISPFESATKILLKKEQASFLRNYSEVIFPGTVL
jgi:hypothetical protein